MHLVPTSPREAGGPRVGRAVRAAVDLETAKRLDGQLRYSSDMFSHFHPVVITSDDPWPKHTFTGYMFSGPNLIIGQDGFSRFRDEKPSADCRRQDGCYFLAQQLDGALQVSADFKGYSKIFIYEKNGRWAVSNSFAELIDQVQEKGWEVTPNEHVLQTWSERTAFWQQLATFETAAEQVRLLPRQNVLTIDEAGTLVESEGSQPAPTPDSSGYGRALARFLSLWIGRIGTCLREPTTTISTELSGGLDSRTAFSLILGLRQYFPVDLTRRLQIVSNAKYPDDLKCAKNITDVYRFKLNTKAQNPGLGLDYLDSFQRWRQFSLGSYAPHYWGSRSQAVGTFTLGGHGGEGHRSYWPYPSPHHVLRSTEDVYASSRHFREAAAAFDQTREVLARSYPGLPEMVAHYQEFRDRFHSGLHAQTSIRLQPLASRQLYSVAAHSSSQAIDTGQMLYDIMFQLSPGLSVMPYDKEDKHPSPEAFAQAARPLALRPMRGNIYFSPEQSAQSPTDLPSSWTILEDLLETAISRLPSGLVASTVIADARSAMKTQKESGKLNHPVDGNVIQHVILADLVSK